MCSVLNRHSSIHEVQTTIRQKRAALALAESQAIPNFDVRLRPAYDFPEQSAMLFVESGMALPIHNRNQGNILEARAELCRSQAQARSAELRLAEQATVAFHRFETARQQVGLFENEILPQAHQSFQQSQALFEVRGERFFDVLDAQRTLAQAKLEHVAALNELWQAISDISGLLQE
jgi:cobalt-zinc-cadmium efflux system outer membrane protein